MSRYTDSKTEVTQNPGREKVGEPNRPLEQSSFTTENPSPDTRTEFLEKYQTEKSVRGTDLDPRILALKEEETRIQGEIAKARVALSGTGKHLAGLEHELDSQYKAGLSNFFLMVSGAREGTENLVKAENALLETQQKTVLSLIHALREVRDAEKRVLEHEQEGKRLEKEGNLLAAQESYNRAQESYLAIQTTKNLKTIWTTPDYERKVREAMGELTRSVVVLDNTETALRTTRSALVVTGATIATGPFGVIGGTLTGTGIGLVSNVPEALGHIYYGNKSGRDAFHDAAIQTAEDAKSSLLAALLQKIPIMRTGTGVVNKEILVTAIPSLQNSAALTLTREIQVSVLGYFASLGEAIWRNQEDTKEKELLKKEEKPAEDRDLLDNESPQKKISIKSKPNKISKPLPPQRTEIEKSENKTEIPVPKIIAQDSDKNNRVSKAADESKPVEKTGMEPSKLTPSAPRPTQIPGRRETKIENLNSLTERRVIIEDSRSDLKIKIESDGDSKHTNWNGDGSHGKEHKSRLTGRRIYTSKRRLDEFDGIGIDSDTEGFEERILSHIQPSLIIDNAESKGLLSRIDPLLAKESLLTDPVQTVDTGERILLLEEWKEEVPGKILKEIDVANSLKAEVGAATLHKEGALLSNVYDTVIATQIMEPNSLAIANLDQTEAHKAEIPEVVSLSNAIDLVVQVSNVNAESDNLQIKDGISESHGIPIADPNKTEVSVVTTNGDLLETVKGDADETIANIEVRSIVSRSEPTSLIPPVVDVQKHLTPVAENDIILSGQNANDSVTDKSSNENQLDLESNRKAPYRATAVPEIILPRTKEEVRDSIDTQRSQEVSHKSIGDDIKERHPKSENVQSPLEAKSTEKSTTNLNEPHSPLTESNGLEARSIPDTSSNGDRNFSDKHSKSRWESTLDNPKELEPLLRERAGLRETLLGQIGAPPDKIISSEEIRIMLERLRKIDSLLSKKTNGKSIQVKGEPRLKDEQKVVSSNRARETHEMKEEPKHRNTRHKPIKLKTSQDRVEALRRQWVTPKKPNFGKRLGEVRLVSIGGKSKSEKLSQRNQNPFGSGKSSHRSHKHKVTR